MAKVINRQTDRQQVKEITFQKGLAAVKMYKFPLVHKQHTYKGKYGIKFETMCYSNTNGILE